MKALVEEAKIEPAAFRKRLSRARTDLHAFMQGNCGLVKEAAACRCARKTKAFIDRGFVDPERLKFNKDVHARVRDVANAEAGAVFRAVTEQYSRLYRDHPFARGPELAGLLRDVVEPVDERDPPDATGVRSTCGLQPTRHRRQRSRAAGAFA